MTLADIKTKIYELTQSDTNLYPSANMLININSWYRNVQTEILASQDNWDFDDTNTSDYPILRTDLNAGQQAYTLPTSTLELKRVEVTYDGTNWSKMTEFDIGERLSATAANNLGDFSTSSPFYDNQYGSIFLYPIPASDVDDGLKIWVSRLITEFSSAQLTAGTTEPGFDPLFHDVLAYGASYEWLAAKDLNRANNVKVVIDERLQKLRKHFGKKAKDEKLALSPYLGWTK